MKRALFFRVKEFIRKRVIGAIVSSLLVAIGIMTPVRAMMPAIAVADDRPSYRTEEVIITAYSSSPDETDDTPHITAYGTETREGIIANNCLPYGTEVQIPDIFGDRVFAVEDRKNSRYGCNWVDVWYPSKTEAKKFGIAREVEMIIFD